MRKKKEVCAQTWTFSHVSIYLMNNHTIPVVKGVRGQNFHFFFAAYSTNTNIDTCMT